MSVPLSDMLLSQCPEADRIGTPEVLVDPLMPDVPAGQRHQALATARDVAGEVLYTRGALPSQRFACLIAREGWWGTFVRLLYAPYLLAQRAVAAAAVIATVAMVVGVEPLQIIGLSALGVGLMASGDAILRLWVRESDDAAIEREAHTLLRQADLHEVLTTTNTD